MEFISCGKTLQLHSFPSLRTLSTYGHVVGHGCYDFQFFRKSKLFVATNPQLSAVEYLSLKSQGTISPVRKLKVDNLSCIACPKNGMDFIAVGLSTGHVRILNYKTRDVMHRFPPEWAHSNSVVSMDFNSTGDYLASAYDSGMVKLYGMKSFIEVDAFNIDKNSTLVRFHPTNRFQLVVASYLGCVSIYDAQAKKKTFHLKRAHTTPCRDVAVSTVNENCLFSVGSDRIINIYDTRAKSVAQQIKTEYPLSAVALSPTALEFLVGNLKGEIVLYDVRKLAKPLTMVQSHDTQVSRLTFVPPERADVDMMSTHSTETHEEVSTTDTGVSLNESVDVFSLLPTVGKKNQAPSEPPQRRDSFMDFLNSIENPRRSLEVPNEQPTTARQSTETLQDFSFITFRKKRVSGQVEPKLSDVKETEESEEKKDSSSSEEVEKVPEKPQKVPNDTLKVPEREGSESPALFCNLQPHSNSTPINMPENPTNLMEDVAKLIKRSENEIKFEMNSLNWKTYNEMFNLWQHLLRNQEELMENVAELSDGMAMLLRTDEVTNEYYRLQEENQALREQLAQINHQFGN